MEWWGSDFWPRLLAYGRLLAVSNKEAAGGENNYSLKSRHRPQHPTPFLWGRAINFTRICHHTLAKGTRRLSGVEEFYKLKRTLPPARTHDDMTQFLGGLLGKCLEDQCIDIPMVYYTILKVYDATKSTNMYQASHPTRPPTPWGCWR